MRKITKEYREDALAKLRALLPDGREVLTLIRSVAKSGMSRHMSLFVICEASEGYGTDRPWLRDITRLVSEVTNYTYDEQKDDLRIPGCGMNMGFEVVYHLAQALHGDGYKLAKREI